MEILQDSDYDVIKEKLENKIPQDRLIKILLEIKRSADLVDHWDSPYTRPTFAKVFLLWLLLFSVIIWLLNPLYTLYFKSEWLEVAKKAILEERWIPSNSSFAFTLKINTDINGVLFAELYPKWWDLLLAKSEIVWNKADLLSSQIWNYKINTNEIDALKITNTDLTSSIKDDILNTINWTIQASDKYNVFQWLDFGVDEVLQNNLP